MPRLTYSKRNAIRQAVEMQALCIESARILDKDVRSVNSNPDTRAKAGTALSNITRAWRVLEEAKRVLKGDPSPGSYRPEKKPRKSRAAMLTMFSESIAEGEEKAEAQA